MNSEERHPGIIAVPGGTSGRAGSSGERLDDRQLVEAFRAGDTEAFRLLMERYAPVLGGFFYGRLRNPADVEDLMQEVFFSAYLHLGRLRRPERFGPWLLRIARNQWVDFVRRERSGPQIVRPLDDPSGAPGRDPLRDAVDPAPDPGARTAARQLQFHVREAIGSMRATYRQILYMKLFDELNSREIASRLNLRHGTVRMRLMRGLEILRGKLRRRGVTLDGSDQ